MPSLGPVVRRALGPFERVAADAYRSFFFDVDDFAARLAAQGGAERILEVGCGEGQLARALCEAFPRAVLLGIDISERVGRLFDGDRSRATFRRATVQEVSLERPRDFDLVVIADVVHHVPVEERSRLLEGVRRCVAPGGRVVVKEWLRTPTPVHLLAFVSDRFVTGDRVAFGTREEIGGLVARSFEAGADEIDELPLRPWKNNVAFVVRG